MQEYEKRPRKSQPNWVAGVFRHPLTIGLYYLAVLMVALIYDMTKSGFSTQTFVLAALGAFVLFVVAIALSALFFRIGRQVEFEDRINDLQEFINAQHMGWIVNDKYIRALEIGSPETWVFTRNLINDLNETGEIFQAVKSNLSSGCKYAYFLPDTPTAYDVVDRFRSVHRYQPGQVQFYLVPEIYFSFYTEVVAYNVNSAERIAIEWLPQESLNYFFALDSKHTDRIIGIGKMYQAKFEPVAATQR